jgi:hypothetical protein
MEVMKKKNPTENLPCLLLPLITISTDLLLARINNSGNNRYPDNSSSRDCPVFERLALKKTRKRGIFSEHLHFWDRRGGVEFPNAVIFHLISCILAVPCIFKIFYGILTFI